LTETTEEHPFYVDGKGWVKAEDLKTGDNLRLFDGSNIQIDSIEIRKLDEEIKVYNFEVDDFHTYFVGTAGFLVHNSCGKKIGIANREMILPIESSHDTARLTLLSELDNTGAFRNGSNKYIGRLPQSYGYGKQIGRVSLDGKVRWRLDFDEKIGVHYNIEDFSMGKGANAVKKIIPINISYEEYLRIIDSWN